jgi:hypothetical protein
MKRILLLLFLSPFLLNAQIVVKKPEVVFDQLIGTWQFGTNMEFESWTKTKHIYQATIYSVVNGDTTVSEKCRILKQKGSYYLEQQVVLNKISSVAKYKLTALDQKLMVFENRTLVFPQKIGYEWLPNGLLSVVQEGTIQGKLEFIDFSYKKVE